MSLGVEHRWERFQNLAGDPDSYENGGYIIPTGTAPFNLAFSGQAPSPGLASFTRRMLPMRARCSATTSPAYASSTRRT